MSKRELDKESMFRKIMPSAQPPAENQEAAPASSELFSELAAPPTQEASQQEQSPAPISPEPPQPSREETLADAVAYYEQQPPQQEAASQPQVQQAPPVPAPITAPAMKPVPAAAVTEETLASIDELQPVNVAEKLVEMYYPRYLQRLDGCSCQRCQDDVFGIALNKITPHYIPASQVSLEDLQDKDLIRETVTHLIKAIFIVKKNPHHDALTSIRK